MRTSPLMPAGLDNQVRWAARRAESGAAVADVPAVQVACELVLSAKQHTNGRVLWVRCLCMAQTAGPPSRRFWQYDPIGEATCAQQALFMWRAHRDARPIPGA